MKPSIPKGTRDFTPQQIIKRNYIFSTIKRVFVKYGYQPIETPTMENLSTLTGKYGQEGDQLLFKVLNNGDFLAKADEKALQEKDSRKIISSISKRGLRYDLTVPFARFVVMHQNEISFPFKRYQIQPVWRADRPQKGRYQEFYQCDVDVVGSRSLMYEAELIKIYDEVFELLGIDTVIKVNNRKILYGVAEAAGIADRFMEMTIAIDKLDKIGITGVKGEMEKRNIPTDAIELIIKILDKSDLVSLKKLLGSSETGLKGIEEMEKVFKYLNVMQLKNEVRFEITLARGLSYYTGTIIEVAAKTVKMGSIGGGGRYDDLTGVFGLRDVSGVGVSFGAERIFDVMEELDTFPKENEDTLQILLIAFDDETHHYAFSELAKLRALGVNADLYPEPVKLKKQMKYANARQVPFVGLIGKEEMDKGVIALKNMATGDQVKVNADTLAQMVDKF